MLCKMKLRIDFCRVNIILAGVLFFFCITITRLTFAQNVVYYFTDFESNDGGLIGTGSWQWGPPFAGPDKAFSDSLCWGTDLSGNYGNLVDIYLESPPIELTNATFPELSFMQWFQFEADGSVVFDGGNVKVSVDGGPFEIIEPFWDYDGTIQGEENVLSDEPVFSGFDNGNFWHVKRFSLEKSIGKTIVIRFHVGSDANINYPGWYIDDLIIKESSTVDVGIWSIDYPRNHIDLNLSPIIPRVTVYNASVKGKSFDTEVAISLDGIQDYVSRKLTNNLAPNTTAEVVFDPWTPSPSTESFMLRARTILDGDEAPSNDSLALSGVFFQKPFSNVTSLVGLDTVDVDVVHFAWGDYNNDGFIDLYIGGRDTDGHSAARLFKNNREGTFKQDHVFSIPQNVWAGDSKWGDYDQDGDLDLFIVDNGGKSAPHLPDLPGLLFRQDDGNFNNVSSEIGFELVEGCCTQSALWLDYDNDGYLDLYIDLGIDDKKNTLYHNEGDGTFEETAKFAGVDSIRQGAATSDFDEDGFMDLLVWWYWKTKDLLFFRNKGDGTFEEIGAQAGLTSSGGVLGAVFGDYNNDGKLDLYLDRQWDLPNLLYRNNGDATFTDVAVEAGVDFQSWSRESSVWADYDNDGDMDLFSIQQNLPRLYQNNGDDTFSLVDAFPVLAINWTLNRTRSTAWADYDNDGDLDLFVSAGQGPGILLRNENRSQNNWIIVRLLGIESNTSGYGARIRLRAGGLLQAREITGGSRTTSYSLRAHFGLGNATRVDTLEIKWPSGVVDLLTDVAVNQVATIEEGNGILTGVQTAGPQFPIPNIYDLAQNYPNPFNPQTSISFEIPEPTKVRLTIYNLLGQEVITLVDEKRNPGQFVEIWHGQDRFGKSVPSGIYIYRLEAGEFVMSRKMILLH